MARRRHSPRREEKKNEKRPDLDSEEENKKVKTSPGKSTSRRTAASEPPPERAVKPSVKKPASPAASIAAPVKRPMPSSVQPMLAESITEPFDSEDWLFEIKWDGYRAVAFIDGGKVRLVSRNQNELTARYPELKDMPQFIKAKNAIVDGEVVALDEDGKASFSLMQQRTGFRPGGKRATANADVPVLYYAFDLIYLDGEDWRRVPLDQRKRKLGSVIISGDSLRYSDHYEER